MAEHEIKTIVAELQSMSPRTQLEIVRLCKKVAELTPDYIDTLSEETKDLLQPLINANAAAIAQEVTDRKAIVELVGNTNKMKSNGADSLAGVYVSDSSTGVINSNLVELAALANLITAASITLDSNKNVKIKSGNYESVFNEDTFTTYQIAATDIYADGIYSKPNSNEILIDCGNKQIKLDKTTHEITLTNNSHVLKLDANGNLTLDGQAVGGGASLYEHNITLSSSSKVITLTIINNDSAVIANKNTIASYLITKNFSSLSNLHNATGYWTDGTVSAIVYGMFASGSNSLVARYYDLTAGNWANGTISTTFTITDIVVQIA